MKLQILDNLFILAFVRLNQFPVLGVLCGLSAFESVEGGKGFNLKHKGAGVKLRRASSVWIFSPQNMLVTLLENTAVVDGDYRAFRVVDTDLEGSGSTGLLSQRIITCVGMEAFVGKICVVSHNECSVGEKTCFNL